MMERAELRIRSPRFTAYKEPDGKSGIFAGQLTREAQPGIIFMPCAEQVFNARSLCCRQRMVILLKKAAQVLLKLRFRTMQRLHHGKARDKIRMESMTPVHCGVRLTRPEHKPERSDNHHAGIAGRGHDPAQAHDKENSGDFHLPSFVFANGRGGLVTGKSRAFAVRCSARPL
ncbi:MAG: hypothetical protein QM699_00080 [Amaricoccus sp.]|uniref:hypothetical protein n=1 Tax=Amaricoccus sp. TaxID=1872485 RepID=UPI0039E60DDA